MSDSDSRKGIVYFDAEILKYTRKVHASEDEALSRAFKAPQVHGMPSIQVAAPEGKLLYLLLRLTGARKVVEVGTLAGYSALWMARALPEDGRLWTVEADPLHAAVARENLRFAALGTRVTVVEGSALDILPALEPNGPFDAVFVDADKVNYERYAEWAAANLRKEGLLIADNAFFFGKLMEDIPEAAALRRFHERAARDFIGVTIGTADGLYLGIRK